MPHSPVGTHNFRTPDAEDGSDNLPKCRRQTSIGCATTQMQEDLQQGAAKAENLALTGNYCPKSKKENSVSALKTTGSRLPETRLIS